MYNCERIENNDIINLVFLFILFSFLKKTQFKKIMKMKTKTKLRK